MNYSQQRNCILNIVVSNPIHPTAEQVYDIAKRSYPKISLGTVYRNLNQLAEHGILKKICSSYGSVRFDGRTDPHFHMICTHCEKMFNVELGEMLYITNKIDSQYSFRITNYKINIKSVYNEYDQKQRSGETA